MYHNTRKNTQVIPKCSVDDVKNALQKVDISNGRIILKEHDKAQWDGQTANVDTGKFYTTELDLTGTKVDAAVKTEEHVEQETPVMQVVPE